MKWGQQGTAVKLPAMYSHGEVSAAVRGDGEQLPEECAVPRHGAACAGGGGAAQGGWWWPGEQGSAGRP